MSLSLRKSLIAFRAEGTVGTFSAPDATHAVTRVYRNGDSPVLTVSRAFTPLEAIGRTGTDGGVTGLGMSSVSGYIHLHGKGASGVPDQGKLLQAAGMGLSTNTYSTTDDVSQWVTLSAGEYIDGISTPARGIMLDGTIELTAGGPARFNFTGVGALTGPASGWSDAALLTGITRESVTPPVWENTSGTNAFTFGTNALRPSLCTINLNRNATPREDPNSYGGVLSGWLNPDAPTITIDPESVARSTINWDALYEAGTEQTLTARVGFSTNNSVTITATRCQLTAHPGFGSRASKLTRSITLQVNGTLSVQYT